MDFSDKYIKKCTLRLHTKAIRPGNAGCRGGGREAVGPARYLLRTQRTIMALSCEVPVPIFGPEDIHIRYLYMFSLLS